MSTVAQIQTAIMDTLQAYLPDGVPVYQVMPAATPNLPAVAVIPSPGRSAEFDLSFGRGTDEWYFDIAVLCSKSSPNQGQELLNQFVCGSGPYSIRQAIYESGASPTPCTCGLSDTTVRVTGVKGYGGRYSDSGIGTAGAILLATAITNGGS